MRLSAVLPFTALAVSLGLTGCGDATPRSTSSFCGELQAHDNEIRTPPAKADEIPALITLYSKMGEVAPLEIEGDWEIVYGSLKTANTVDANNPASVQQVADTAYAAQQSATNVANWAKNNCNVDLGPIAIVPGGAGVAPPTTTPVTGG
jgi:hypothetical protein